MAITRPTFQEERVLWQKGYDHVIGIDEVGRGAFAGPVVVGAVIFRPNTQLDLPLVNDSKLLSSIKRIEALSVIQNKAFYFATEQCEVPVINRVGIGKATEIAFRKIIQKIRLSFINSKIFVLVDGFQIKHIKGIGLRHQKAIIKGDQKSMSIAAASIVAKVTRDKIMTHYHSVFPLYGFDEHKGYGTKKHQEAIEKYKLSKLHRKSFDLSAFL